MTLGLVYHCCTNSQFCVFCVKRYYSMQGGRFRFYGIRLGKKAALAER